MYLAWTNKDNVKTVEDTNHNLYTSVADPMPWGFDSDQTLAGVLCEEHQRRREHG